MAVCTHEDLRMSYYDRRQAKAEGVLPMLGLLGMAILVAWLLT